MKKQKVIYAAIAAAGTLVIACVSILFTNVSSEWYLSLQKPSIKPPDYIYPIIWTIIYITMAVVYYFILDSRGKRRTQAIIALALNAVLSVAWLYIFYQQHNVMNAFIALLLMFLTLMLSIYWAWDQNKAASYIMIPNLVWTGLAIAVDYCILLLN